MAVQKKKSSAYVSRGQEIPVVPPQFTPMRRPHGILADPQAVSGPTRLRLLSNFSEAAPKGIPHPIPHCLAPTGSSLAEMCGYVLVFIHALSVCIAKFTTFAVTSQYSNMKKYTKFRRFSCLHCRHLMNICVCPKNFTKILQYFFFVV